MTYIVKHMNNGTIGVYDTDRACFPIARPELYAAGIERIAGSAPYGWFTKAEEGEAKRIADHLNLHYGHGEYVEAVVSRPKAKPSQADDSLALAGAALIADQA